LAQDGVQAGLSSEEQRFREQKAVKLRAVALNYLRSAFLQADNLWSGVKFAESGRTLITKVVVSINSKGRVQACDILQPSASSHADQSVKTFVSSLVFPALPSGMSVFKLYWTFMSDGTMNMLENSQTPEANAYNIELLGGTVTPTGSFQSGPSIASTAGSDFGPYMVDLQKRIKRAWFPPRGNESKRVSVVFKVQPDGTMTDLRLDESSGVSIADQAALKAIEISAPFRPLPFGSKLAKEIKFVFDYNVYSGGGHATFTSY
jgi:TonB family protein